MLLLELTGTSRQIADTSKRSEKVERLAQCLRALDPAERAIGTAYLSGELPQGKLGIGYATLRGLLDQAGVASGQLTLREVDQTFSELANSGGAGSAGRRKQLLAGLFACATRVEQEFLSRLLLGELRQGALAGLMVEAIASAAAVPLAAVRRAVMLCGDLASVALSALNEAEAGLRRYKMELFRPLQPMLAQPVQDVHEALAQLKLAALEWKLDGARVQVHKSEDEVRVYTRTLNDVSAAVPEIITAVRSLPPRQLILDGETIALRSDGAPQPFQVTMRRFGRKADEASLRAALPLSTFFFDCLKLDDDELIDKPLQARHATLAAVVPPEMLVTRLVTGAADAAQAFLQGALQRGHEGIMAKSLDAPYEAGNRGSSWLKIKQATTLDLVVLAAEWGSGRRKGWLSNLHLGARDPASSDFVMLGKTFKGMTDAMLTWQTEALLKLEIGRDDYTVYVRPELVVEIAFNDVQASSHYPGGLALRFARVKRYRQDKAVADADTITTVRALHARQSGGAALPD